MTEALGREAESDTTSNPLAVLKPLVVVATDNYATSVVLGVDSVTRDQRDAAIKFLNELIGSGGYDSSFKLIDSGLGGLYALRGTTKLVTSGDEFRAIVNAGIQPEFHRVGELKIEIARKNTRHMIGVECTLTASSRGSRQEIPELDTVPPEVHGLVHEGSTVAFSLKNVTDKKDSELIAAALRVANAFGVYVDNPPSKVGDKDPRARMYPEFNYVERSAA
jgi:hypothetical protein